MAVRLIAAMLIAAAAPAFAQTKPVELRQDANKPFKHANSGITLPATLIGLPRATGSEYVKPQLDVAFRYFPADNAEEVSVYIYRVTSGSPSLWFDVSRNSIEQRQSFGRKTRYDLPVAFTPPGQATASALKAAWTLSNGPLRSTALAIVPVGEWLVKVRYSSTTLEAASLVRRLDEVIAAIGWPGKIPAAPAAAGIEDCTSPLALNGASKPVAADGAALLLDAMTAAVERGKAAKGEAEKTPPVAWCRDRKVEAPAATYRPMGSDNSYLLAWTDSGQAVWARPSLGALLGDGKASWAVSIVLAGQTINYGGRDRLPPPGEIESILKGNPASRVTTWGTSQINIDSSQLK